VLGGSPSSPEDLYEVYARLRAEDPIHRTPEGLWILTRYADVSVVLRDPRFGREGSNGISPRTTAPARTAAATGSRCSSGTRRTTAAAGDRHPCVYAARP
jgi:cytochrome P450